MLIKNVGFHQKILKDVSFDILTWKTIYTLLDQNRSFKESLEIIKNVNNAYVIEYIVSLLEDGVSIEEVILKMNTDPVCRQLQFFISFVPFKEALQTAFDIVQFENHLKKSLLSTFVYPIFLILFSSLLLFLFSCIILPSIQSMLDVSDFSFLLVIKCLNVLMFIMYVSVIILCLIVSYCFVRHKLLDLWNVLHKFRLDGLFKKYLTFVFAQYLYVLMEHGVSTRKSMDILIRYENKPLIRFIALKLHEQLMHGKSFIDVLNDSYLDSTFCMLCHLGYQTNSFMQSLIEYKNIIELWLQSSIKKLSVYVQMFAYGCIGVVVIIVYRIMLLPMSILDFM